jgi:replicative DNA helicase
MGTKIDSTEYIYPGAKTAAMYVLAGLVSDPLTFANAKYHFDINDFPEQFQRIIFGAVEHLAKEGHSSIDWTKIEAYLKPYPTQYQIFTDNRGIDYIQNALSLYHPSDFGAYYSELKKYRLMNELSKAGIDITDIYNEEVDPVAHEVMQRKFDDMTIGQILALEEEKVIHLKDQFSVRSSLIEGSMSEGIADLIKRDRQNPIMGLPLTSPKLTTLYLGLRKGGYYIESAGTGVGKSRRMAAESCHLAYPYYYDLETKQWEYTGLSQRVLFISTELERDEQQRICLAYISGVEQIKIALNKCTAEEAARVDRAGEIMEKYPNNLYFVPMSNFTDEDVENIIEKYHQIYHVDYFFFDYLMSNEDMLAEGSKKIKISNVREDMLLLGLSTTLKNLCKEQQIMIWTATQLTLEQDSNMSSSLNERSLRGAKSIADKADDGAILMGIRTVDKPSIDQWYAQHPEYKGREDLAPNAVLHFYKMRLGKYAGTKLFVHFDRGTCRMTDCFATDKDGQLFQLEDTKCNIRNVRETDVEQYLNKLNAINANAVDAPKDAPQITSDGVVASADYGKVRDDPLPESLEPKKRKAAKTDFDF